jgi:hypothetical protein
MRDNQQLDELAEQLLRLGMVVGELEHVRSELREILFRHDDAGVREALERFLEVIDARMEKLEGSARAKAVVTWLDTRAS